MYTYDKMLERRNNPLASKRRDTKSRTQPRGLKGALATAAAPFADF
jgi:hypothetical protein